MEKIPAQRSIKTIFQRHRKGFLDFFPPFPLISREIPNKNKSEIDVG